VSLRVRNYVSQFPNVFPRAPHIYATFFAPKFSLLPFSPSLLYRGAKEKALYFHTETSILGRFQRSGF
jgi:hypothetical protein